MTTFKGTSESDYLIGTEQNDIIYGYEGDDILIGGSGKDKLIGGGGNDILTGGNGRDTFELYPSGGGIDTITDFSGKDKDILVVNDFPIDVLRHEIGQADNGSLPKSNTIKASGKGGLPNGGTIIATMGSVSSYLTYDANTGALFYLERQLLAWLPPNLDFLAPPSRPIA